jgi:4-hydroxybenzoate polyprenyltransferase
MALWSLMIFVMGLFALILDYFGIFGAIIVWWAIGLMFIALMMLNRILDKEQEAEKERLSEEIQDLRTMLDH